MKNKGKHLILLGLLLIAAALLLTGYNLYDALRAARAADQAAAKLEALLPETAPNTPDYLLHPEMEMPVQEIDGVGYIGTLRVPALGLELPVISQWSYPMLKRAPCRYVGSAYLDNLVIAAHNYNSHFGGLKKLSPGDAVTFTDVDGNVFCYEVAALETLAPTAIEEMTDGGYALTLFTCTPGGASRVTVRCDRTAHPGAGEP